MCLDIHLALSFPMMFVDYSNYLKARQLIGLTKLNKQSSIRFFSRETKKKNYFPPPLNRKSRLWMKWKLLVHLSL